MLLTVIYEDGIKRSYKNVTKIQASIRYDDKTERPVYEIKFPRPEHRLVLTLRYIKSFEIDKEDK